MRTFTVIASLLALPAVARAQLPDTLPRVVITATRVDASAAASISAATTIDREAIARLGVRDVAELLRLVPGAQVVRTGGPGAQSSLFLRGGENDYVRILVDGVPVNEPGGAVDLAWLSLDDIERVEVVRGPASVLYGTDAVTGVIQLFTRRGHTVPVEVAASAGRYGTHQVSGIATAGSARLNATLSGARERSDGILAFNSGYARDVAGLGVRGNVADATHVDVAVRGVRDEYHFPTDGAGAVVDRNAFRTNRRLTTATTVTRVFTPRIRGEASLASLDSRGRDDDRPDSPADTVGFTTYRAGTSVRRRTGDVRLHVATAATSVLTLGVDWGREVQRGDDSSNFSTERSRFAADRRNAAVYGQWLADQGPWSFSVGARYDDNTTFGTFRTARAGVSLRTWAGGTVRATAGTAFKAPTFFESFNSAFSMGNPDLVPERSRAWEAGLRQRLGGRMTIGLTWFDQRFRDMIQYAFLSPDQPNYFNVAAATARGLEVDATVQVTPRVRAMTSTTWLTTRVDDAGHQSGEAATFVEGNRLLRRPSVHASGRLAAELPRDATADLAVTFTGRRDDRDFSTFPATPVILPSWSRVDLGMAVPFVLASSGPRLTLVARLENVLGTTYQEIANFPAPGRSLTIGVRAATVRQ